MSARSTTTTVEGSDVYEAYIKPKGVKDKWIQTENFDQGKDDIPIFRRAIFQFFFRVLSVCYVWNFCQYLPLTWLVNFLKRANAFAIHVVFKLMTAS